MDESIILMKLLDLTVKQDWEKKKKFIELNLRTIIRKIVVQKLSNSKDYYHTQQSHDNGHLGAKINST